MHLKKILNLSGNKDKYILATLQRPPYLAIIFDITVLYSGSLKKYGTCDSPDLINFTYEIA